MSLLREDGDIISPSLLDIQVMLVLAELPKNAYQVFLQLERDDQTKRRQSLYGVQTSLGRLTHTGLVSRLPDRHFELTQPGREVLAQQLGRLNAWAKLGEERLKSLPIP